MFLSSASSQGLSELYLDFPNDEPPSVYCGSSSRRAGAGQTPIPGNNFENVDESSLGGGCPASESLSGPMDGPPDVPSDKDREVLPGPGGQEAKKRKRHNLSQESKRIFQGPPKET